MATSKKLRTALFLIGASTVSAAGIFCSAASANEPVLASPAPVQATADSNRTIDATPVSFRGERWRYRYHNNHWWYWLPNNSWTIWYNGAWIGYNPNTYYNYYPRYSYYSPGYSYYYPNSGYYGGYSYPHYRGWGGRRDGWRDGWGGGRRWMSDGGRRWRDAGRWDGRGRGRR